jgi:molybdenum ABC transporter molybdate-binding protein
LTTDGDVGGLDQGRNLVACLKPHVLHRACGDDGGHVADGGLDDDLTQHLVRDYLLHGAGYFVANRLFHKLDKLGIKALLEPSICKIAVANPEHAPYGRAAVTAMKALNVYDQVVSRIVYGENIAQTAQFVQSGAADVGILALSLAVAPQMRDAGRFWQVPLDAYPRMEQGGIILKSSKNLETARAFRDFVLGDQGREVLKRYGFYLPEK